MRPSPLPPSGGWWASTKNSAPSPAALPVLSLPRRRRIAAPLLAEHAAKILPNLHTCVDEPRRPHARRHADHPDMDGHRRLGNPSCSRPDRRLVSVLMSRSVMPVFSRAVRLADRQPGERDAGRAVVYRAAPATQGAMMHVACRSSEARARTDLRGHPSIMYGQLRAGPPRLPESKSPWPSAAPPPARFG